jgi:deazaflavin-dependent oxidoreductase (nitroreductase family)
MTTRYDAPGFASRLVNTAVRWLAERGVSIQGSALLQVRGRASGQTRAVVVNVLTVDGRDYVLSPRGNTQWARNVRAAGEVRVGSLRTARLRRTREVSDDAKLPLLRSYLQRWHWEVKGHTGGLTLTSTDDEIREVAPSIPTFELTG